MKEFTFVCVWNTAWVAWLQSSGLWMLIIRSVYSLGIPFLFSLGLPVSEALLTYVQGKNSLWRVKTLRKISQMCVGRLWFVRLCTGLGGGGGGCCCYVSFYFFPYFSFSFTLSKEGGKEDRNLFKCPRNTATLFTLWKRWRGCGRYGKLKQLIPSPPSLGTVGAFWNFSLCNLLPPLS